MLVSADSIRQFVLHSSEDGAVLELDKGVTLGPSAGYRADLILHPSHFPNYSSVQYDGYEAPALSIRALDNATLTRRHGIVLDQQSRIVPESASGRRYVDASLASAIDITVLSDEKATLSATGYSSFAKEDAPLLYTMHGGYTVFGHFLYETMGSIWGLRPLVMSGDVKVVMPPPGPSWPNSMLDALGVPDASRFQSGSANICSRRLIVSSSTWGSQTFNPIPMMRELVQSLKEWNSAKPGKRRLYLTRSGAATSSGRFVANEAELFEMLASFGFIAVEPSRYTFAQQIRIFAQAEAIVGLHGSAFANAIFAEPGSTVIDLLPDYWAESGGAMWCRNFSNLFALQYAYHICKSQKTRQGYAVSVDVDALREKLSILFGI